MTRAILDAGYLVSVTPEVVYRERDRELVEAVPLESLLVESDGPWPYGGEFEGMASGPWLVSRVAEEVAKIKRLPVDESDVPALGQHVPDLRPGLGVTASAVTTESSVIDAERLQDEFLDLVCISSLSKREGAIARRLEAILKGMGATIEVDDAGERVGGETGNLLARFPGNAPGAPPFLLSCHMDTVGPAARSGPSSTATSFAPTGPASSAATTRRGSSRSSRRSACCASARSPTATSRSC